MEVWKQVNGFEDAMIVSSFGRIKNIKTNRILNGCKHKTKTTTYIRIYMPDGSRKLLHRIVADSFLENKESKPFINHIDNNGENNHLSNIEWCTQSENMIHAMKQGRLTYKLEKARPIANLTNKNKAIEKAKAIIGNIYGGIEILSISGTSNGYTIANTRCTKCMCEKERNLSKVMFAKPLMCEKCSYKVRFKKSQ